MDRTESVIVGSTGVAHALTHTFTLSIPLFIPIWIEAFSVSEFVIGTLAGAGYFMFGAGAIPTGLVVDEYGSRLPIAACLAGMGLSGLLLGIAPSIAVLAVGLLLLGGAASIYHPAGLSLLSKGVENTGKAFGWHGMAGNVGIALGPLSTAILLLFFDWRLVWGLLAVPALGAAAAVLLLDIDESGRPVEGSRARESAAGVGTDGGSTLRTARSLFTPRFALLFLIVIVAGLYYRGLLTFFPTYITRLDLFAPIRLGSESFPPGRYLYSAILLVGVLGQYTGGYVAEHRSKERMLAASFVALGVLALLYVRASASAVPMLAASALLGYTLFIFQPIYQALVADYSPAEARGLSYGIFYLGTFGIGAAAAGIAGYAVTYFDFAVLFAVLAAFAFAGAGLSAVLAVRRD